MSPESSGTVINHTPYPGGATRFDDLWSIYPNHANRLKAERRYLRIAPTVELQQTMRSAIEAQRLSRKWTKDDGEFVPEFATWLRNARWLDEVCAPVVAARPWHETRGASMRGPSSWASGRGMRRRSRWARPELHRIHSRRGVRRGSGRGGGMRVTVAFDPSSLKSVQSQLAKLSGQQAKQAYAEGLNDGGFQGRREWQREMRDRFDRPTPTSSRACTCARPRPSG